MAIWYKKYDREKDYLVHQSSKINTVTGLLKSNSSEAAIARFVKELTPLVRLLPEEGKKSKVLCLGSRRGAEVAAFRRIGFPWSIGIDVNPGPQEAETFGSPECVGVVTPGDFHRPQFKDESFDMVYWNCLDHCLDLGRVLTETHRILKAKKHLILRFPRTNTIGRWESCFWDDEVDVLNELHSRNFRVIYDRKTTHPAKGRTEVSVIAIKKTC